MYAGLLPGAARQLGIDDGAMSAGYYSCSPSVTSTTENQIHLAPSSYDDPSVDSFGRPSCKTTNSNGPQQLGRERLLGVTL